MSDRMQKTSETLSISLRWDCNPDLEHLEK
jgi:hypothetical protein